MSKIFKEKDFGYPFERQNNDDVCGALKLCKCDDKYPIWDLGKEEFKHFLDFCEKFENMKWRNIKTYNGFKYENIPELEVPDYLAKDVTLQSLRVTDKFRLIGYRDEFYYYVIHFDRNHETYKG